MTPQAKALRSAVAAAVGPGKVDAALRAVVEELGLEDEHVDDVYMANALLGFSSQKSSESPLTPIAEALYALLEASGADR